MKGEKTLMIIFKILYNKEGNILIDDSIQKLTKKEVLHLKKDILISILDSFQLDRSNYTSNNNQSFTVKIKIGREIKYSTCKVEFIDYNEEYLSFIIYHPRDVNIQYHVKIVNDCLLQFFKILDNLHSIQDEKNKYKAIISNNKVEKEFDKELIATSPSLDFNNLFTLLKEFIIEMNKFERTDIINHDYIKDFYYPTYLDTVIMYKRIAIKRYNSNGLMIKFVHNKKTYKLIIDGITLEQLLK